MDIEEQIHWLLQDEAKIGFIDDEPIEIYRENASKPYLEYKNGRYEKANWNSPGRAGALVQQGHTITICIFTGAPWKLLIDGRQDGI